MCVVGASSPPGDRRGRCRRSLVCVHRALGVPKKPGTIDPQTGIPEWLGQREVAAQRIAGVVIDERGAPIRGVTVRLAATHIHARLVKEPIVVTDESGRFDFGPQPATTYIVGAEMRPFTPVLLRVELRASTAPVGRRIRRAQLDRIFGKASMESVRDDLTSTGEQFRRLVGRRAPLSRMRC
jgi:hypothetical protein